MCQVGASRKSPCPVIIIIIIIIIIIPALVAHHLYKTAELVAR